MEKFISYFSMEIGLRPEIPTYSGGLGILAGDTIKSCADQGIPLIGITLLSEKGYFHQEFDQDNYQKDIPVLWKKEDFLELLPLKIKVKIESRIVTIQAWKYTVKGKRNIDIYYLDTNLPENSDYDRTLTSRLYGGDYWYRMCQEIILGIGGIRLLRALKIPIKKYHMNEGHAAFLILELIREHQAENYLYNYSEYDSSKLPIVESIRNSCVFTTHTPVPAGHDAFDLNWIKQAIGEEFNIESNIKNLNCIKDNKFNMTLLALNFSSHINGVAKKHQEVSEQMFPGYVINAITNGVHAETWTSEPIKNIFDKYIKGWREDNFMLRYALNIPHEEIWNAHQKSKKELVEFINKKSSLNFSKDVLTIGFARRFASYKRADLLFRDLDRLTKIGNKGKIQIIMAGKAHPKDEGGIKKLKYIKDLINDYNSNSNKNVKIIFLDNYEMWLAQKLVSGCDVWLNTPIRPQEASGTSGMKAALNGVLHFSVLDGWWLEGWVEDVTGWAIGPFPKTNQIENNEEQDINDLYDKLENKIIKKYYSDRNGWIFMMKHAISHNGSFFNTQRMISQYLIRSWLD